MRPDHGTLLAKNAYTYAFRIVPSYQALVRRWRVAVDCSTQVDVSINGATAVTDPRPGDESPARGIVIDEVLGSQTSSESAATVQITGDSAPTVESIECVELPRAFIAADSNEFGVELSPFRGSQPIRADAFENIYAGAMNEDAGRRVLFQWAVPYMIGASTSTSFAASTTSGTFSDVFDVAKPCLARKKFNDGNDFTRCAARVFAWVSGGGVGEVRIASASGNSSTIAIGDTTPKWSAEIDNVRVLHEDLAEADGIPSGGFDDVDVQFRATSGTIYIASALLVE